MTGITKKLWIFISTVFLLGKYAWVLFLKKLLWKNEKVFVMVTIVLLTNSNNNRNVRTNKNSYNANNSDNSNNYNINEKKLYMYI